MYILVEEEKYSSFGVKTRTSVNCHTHERQRKHTQSNVCYQISLYARGHVQQAEQTIPTELQLSLN